MPAPTTMADLGGLLKNVYADVRKDVFPVITPLLAQVQKSVPGGRLQWGGNGVFWDVKTSRDVGMISSSSGFLPADAVASETQASMDVKRLYVYREIDGLAITGTQSQEAAYLSVVRKAMDSIKVAIKLGLQEQLHGDGNFIKGLVAAVTSTTVVDVTRPYGVSTAVGQGGLLLDAGMPVAVLNGGSPSTVRGYSTIASVVNSGDTCTVTFTSAIAGMATNDIVVPAASASDNSYGKAINGLLNITNRGGSYASLHGISAASAPRWDAVRMVAGADTADATQPSEIDIIKLLTKVYQKCGVNPREKPSEFLLVTTPSLEIKLAESFLGQRQFSMGQMELKGGFTALQVAGLPLVSDPFCPAGTIYCVRTADLTWVDAKDWGQISYGSDNAWRPIAGRDAFGTAFGAYLNFGALARNSHGSITGYTDTERFTFVA